MSRYVAVAGTHAWRGGMPGPDDWWSADSAFSSFLLAHGHEHLAPGRPFIWSTDLAGVPSWQFWRRPSVLDWEAAGHALYAYCVPPWCRHEVEVSLITHSHGLQVALWACALGLRVTALIDVSGPVRQDMRPIAEKALPNIGRWLHIHSDRSDLTQILGALFDGHVGPERLIRLPGVVNAEWPGVGHSRLLHEVELFPVWEDQRWLDYLA